jgi:hypothetical protein
MHHCIDRSLELDAHAHTEIDRQAHPDLAAVADLGGLEYVLRFAELIPSRFSRHTWRNMTPKPLAATTGPSSSVRQEITP